MIDTNTSITTVSDLYNSNQLTFTIGQYNIINCGIRTGKTYWAVQNLPVYTRDGKKARVLFLVDTIALKNQIINEYSDYCCAADEFWRQTDRQWSLDEDKIGIMCYQELAIMSTKERYPAFLNQIDVICWDECDSIFDFAASTFAKARKSIFTWSDNSNAEILVAIQKYCGNKEYAPLLLLALWEKLLKESRILCIGLSASPERARSYYESLIHASNLGQLEMGYRNSQDIYFLDILEQVKSLTPEEGVGYWCFSPSITNNQSIIRAAKLKGFNAIEIHSKNNTDYPLSEEQLRVIELIETVGLIPYEYDFVVFTKAFERGISLRDTRFKNLIVDSYYQVDRIQAGRQTFPYQRYVKVLATPIPDEYLYKPLSVKQCRELAKLINISEDVGKTGANRGRTMSWNKLQTILPIFGYQVEKKKMYNAETKSYAQMYMITGTWKDVEVTADNDFMQLVNAKMQQNLLEE